MAKNEPLIDKIERLMFGASAQERVDMMIELAARRVEARIVAALEPDGEPTETPEDASNGKGARQ